MEDQFNPVAEFATLFPKEIPRELPPLRKINHKINIIPGWSRIPTYRPSGDRFKQEITDKINSKDISGRVYRAEDDTNAVVMFTQPKRDRPKEARFLLDCRPRNAVTIRNQTPLPNIGEAIQFLPPDHGGARLTSQTGTTTFAWIQNQRNILPSSITCDITEAASCNKGTVMHRQPWCAQ